MTTEHFLVTGAFGCIGASVVATLLKEGTPTTLFDIANNPHRMRLLMNEEEIGRVNFIQGDITQLEALERVVQENGITHIIHLAALQASALLQGKALFGSRRQCGGHGECL
jgi:UDP-glucose 4-epimerase